MDLGKEACPIYASEPYNRPFVIAQYRLERVSVSLVERRVRALSVHPHGTSVTAAKLYWHGNSLG